MKTILSVGEKSTLWDLTKIRFRSGFGRLDAQTSWEVLGNFKGIKLEEMQAQVPPTRPGSDAAVEHRYPTLKISDRRASSSAVDVQFITDGARGVLLASRISVFAVGGPKPVEAVEIIRPTYAYYAFTKLDPDTNYSLAFLANRSHSRFTANLKSFYLPERQNF